MKLTNPEKLIVTMLCDIHAKLGISNSVDPEFVSDAMFTGNTWALTWQYPGTFESSTDDTPQHVRDVVNILDTWDFVEAAVEKLGAEDLEALNTATGKTPTLFAGFDGHNEIEWLSAARFLVRKLHRFERFEKHDMDSHSPTVDSYLRMYEAFEPIRAKLLDRGLSREELAAILSARYA